MALILAVNPGSTQSATLARVARQLHGHELIGADSCAVAMKALEQRMPALVLLPSTATKGEAELLQRLAPARVPSLRLPSPTSVDPRALADEIRELLGERLESPAAHPIAEQRPPSTSIHLIMAATAAIDWIRARRASWPPLPATTPAPATIAASAAAPPPELEPVYEYAARTHTPKAPKAPKTIEWEPPAADTWAPPPPSWESERRPAPSRASAAAAETRELIVAWLPRVLALAVVAGLVWVGIGYWPRVVAGVSSAISMKEPAGTAAARPEAAPPPAATTPARGGRGASGAAAAAANAPGGSGFLAVFSSVEITVSEGTTAIPLDDRSQAMLPAGRHRLRFQNRSLGYDEVRTVQIKPTETTTLNLTPQTTIAVTSNEPAEVSIDGAVVGGTPLKGHRIALGTHTVIVRAAGGERQVSVDATSKPVQLEIDFSKPQ